MVEVVKERTNINKESIDKTLDLLHVKFGAALLSSWRFPDEFKQISLYHNELSSADVITKGLLTVNFSNLLVRKLRFSAKEDDGTDLADVESARLLKLTDKMVGSISNEVYGYVKGIRNMILN